MTCHPSATIFQTVTPRGTTPGNGRKCGAALQGEYAMSMSVFIYMLQTGYASLPATQALQRDSKRIIRHFYCLVNKNSDSSLMYTASHFKIKAPDGNNGSRGFSFTLN
jgi:hypothetical protein